MILLKIIIAFPYDVIIIIVDCLPQILIALKGLNPKLHEYLCTVALKPALLMFSKYHLDDESNIYVYKCHDSMRDYYLL